jgi:CP family cyanate transporter-like MFS transporter
VRPLALVAVLMVGLNLRGAIAAVSPVLADIRAELGLTPSAAGLLTTLPVLCFAAVAPASAWAGRRVGARRAVLLGLLALAAGTVLRVLGGVWLLVAGTVVVGAAMTVGNVLLPVLVKRDFGSGAGPITGLYTAALAGGAALTAALTAPAAQLWGWRAALAGWAVLALGTAVVWQVAGRRAPRAGDVPPPPPAAGTGVRVWRHPVAWAATLLLGTQSIAYYSTTAWLPTLLTEDAGTTVATAALAASLFQVLGIPAALAVPALVGRRPGQTWLALAVALAWGVLFAGLLLAPSAWPAWVVAGGLAQGAGISLAFTVLVLRAADADVVRRLSSMSQLVAYTMGAAGPFAVGALYAAGGGWTLPLLLMVAASVGMAVSGWLAGRPVLIGARTVAG